MSIDRECGCRGVRCGFSLVEMLLVIAVIGLLISMLLPALSGARDTALRVRSQSMIADLTNAAQRFGNDNAGRNPGYFSERLMGHSDNIDIGMSAMENAMLELGGSAVVIASGDDANAPGADPDAGIIYIGPSADPASQVVVNINLIGAEGAYYTPELGAWAAQVHESGNPASQQAGAPGGDGQELMPDLLDAWGNPLLVWSRDPGAPGSIIASSDANEMYTQIVRTSSDGIGALGDATGPSWFYLASNAGFLEAPSFGSSGIDMSADPTTGRASVIGTGVEAISDEYQRIRTLGSVLASPSSYVLDPGVDRIDDAGFEQIFPARARGRFLVHSAGSDGVFLSSTDQGWSENGLSGGADYHLDFGNSFYSQSDVRLTDDDGAFTTVDLFEPFDDLLFGAK